MVERIGKTAGRVWEFLNNNGKMTVAQLAKKLDVSANEINQAVGWLAREEKLNFEEKGKTVKVSLK